MGNVRRKTVNKPRCQKVLLKRKGITKLYIDEVIEIGDFIKLKTLGHMYKLWRKRW